MNEDNDHSTVIELSHEWSLSSFIVGFSVAYPVNAYLLKRGAGHAITHSVIGHHVMDNRPLIFALIAFMLGGFLTALLS